MWTVAKADVGSWVSVGAEGVGVVEGKWIAVSRSEGHQHTRARWDGDIAYLIVGTGVAVEVLNGAGVADMFFDGLRDEVWIGADHVVLIGALGVGVQHPAEQVGRCLVTGDQKQDGDIEQLVVSERSVGVVLQQASED